MTDYEKAVEAMKRLMKPDYSKYEKATQAMNWLRENTCNHYVVDETAFGNEAYTYALFDDSVLASVPKYFAIYDVLVSDAFNPLEVVEPFTSLIMNNPKLDVATPFICTPEMVLPLIVG